MKTILELLQEGDLHTTGNVDNVVQIVERTPSLLSEVIQFVKHDDPGVRMRACDALEKISHKHPDWLQPYKKIFINELALTEQKEVQWHLCQIFPKLELTTAEKQHCFEIVHNYFLNTNSRIVMAFALQSMVELSVGEPELIVKARQLLNQNKDSKVPAVKVRVRNLLKELS